VRDALPGAAERERRGILSRTGEAVSETLGQVSLRRRWVGGTRPWRVSASAFPEEGPIEERARFLVRYAVLAPSSYNTQPWRFIVDDDEIRLFADLDRWLTVADSDKRELYLSLGAALENLLVAAEHFGLDSDVAYLPGSDSTHAATVRLTDAQSVGGTGGETLGEQGEVSGGYDNYRGESGSAPSESSSAPSEYRDSRLFTAIPHRRTTRRSFRDTSIPTTDLQTLYRRCVEDDVSLQLIAEPETLATVADLTARANQRLYADPAYRRELGRWVGRGAFGDPWLVAKVRKVAVTHLNVGRQRARRDGRAVREGPVLAVLCTEADDRRCQIRAGQAYERLSLLAIALGIATHPVSAPLEVGTLRRELNDLLGRPDRPAQRLFRLGYPEREGDSRPPPRRAAETVLVD
jgi:nitroreductase